MDKDKHDEWNTAIALLLKLLSHESDGVKQLAYEHLKVRISYTVTLAVCKHYHTSNLHRYSGVNGEFLLCPIFCTTSHIKNPMLVVQTILFLFAIHTLTEQYTERHS